MGLIDYTHWLVQYRAIGATLICFRADGCMAHDHKFQWIGIIESFAVQPHGDPILQARVKILKRDDLPTDIRDGDQGYETVIAANISHLERRTYMVML